MPAVSVILDLAPERGRAGWIQPLAGGTLWTSFEMGGGARPAAAAQSAGDDERPAGPWRLIYEGPGESMDGKERIRAWIAADGRRRLDYDDGESFQIQAGGVRVTRSGKANRSEATSASRALAAPLTLALATQGVYLLHASAVAGSSGVIALAGASGIGKSTLAGAAPAAGLRRVADDQLPVLLADPIVALPHFPQLKIGPDSAYPPGDPPGLPLAALVELEPDAEATACELRRRSGRDATVALVRAGTGLRLFDPPLLATHFEAASGAGLQLPVFGFRFPRKLDRLAEAAAVLTDLDRRLAEASYRL